ncbi:hypothetical protein [Pseudomonas sp. S1(2024)]|uniref:hypothetical protein n=1 Tax=Pseudomonas sp. S1(2024) TaxID=3390191 RepID=UPI00397A79F3
MNTEDPMSAQKAKEALKQCYVKRAQDFRQLYIANRKTQEHSSTISSAILLACDLLDDYGHIGKIAETFQDQLQDDGFQMGVFGAFMNALTIEHERLDHILEQTYLDHSKHYPAQLLAINPARTAMMTYYPSPSLVDGQQKPQLWDSEGNLRHIPSHFITTRKASVDSQLHAFYEQNDPALLRVIRSLPELETAFRGSVVELLSRFMIMDHVAIDDPRRMALIPYLDTREEFSNRLYQVIGGLNHENSSTDLPRAVERLFDLFRALDTPGKQSALASISKHLCEELISKDNYVGYAGAVQAYADFLGKARSHGFDDLEFFATQFQMKDSRKQDVFRRVAAELLIGNSSVYVGEPVRRVLCAAFLLNQEDDVLLASDISGDALLSLYMLKGDERYKDALRTPDKADVLLAYDMGL